MLAALLGATAFTVWNQSVVNEKVYTVSLAFFARRLVADGALVRRSRRARAPIACSFSSRICIGLGYTNHPAGFLVGAGRRASRCSCAGRDLLRWRLVLAGVVALVLGLTPFALEPIRAAHHPALNEGEPTGCATKIGFACTFSSYDGARLMANMNREQYGKPNLSERQAPFTAQIGMWWLYFKWQWLRDRARHAARAAGRARGALPRSRRRRWRRALAARPRVLLVLRSARCSP